MEDIKDIRMPVEFPVWGWVLVGLLVTGLLVGLWLWYYRRKKPNVQQRPVVPARPPGEIALERLEELRLKDYPALGLFKEFYVSLSDIVRHYLENQFGIKAPEMTTEEFLVFAQNSTLLSDAQKLFLKDFLNGCDMVKFAKHLPTVNEAQGNFNLAKKLIAETSHGI